ncbi:MAG TPA: alpha/beta fold hydrolase [Terriglobales bacterium]|nr:alpha/beta fold hydrolase [Terriglobales bacterium]
MPTLKSNDAELFYEVQGDGPAVVVLHAFPADHELWLPAAQILTSRYRVILPDLRAHGASEAGEGPVTMEKHAADLIRILDDAEVGRAAFAGVSIGGYILFEFWRRYQGRVASLALIDTKAQPDTDQARANRLKTATEVLETGVEPFVDSMIPKLLGETTRRTRPDLVDAARKQMLKMSPQDISLVQRGMAERADSVPTLKTINVPTLVAVGDEDIVTTTADAELMRQNIPSAQMKTIPRAGHFAVWEQPEDAGRILRQFLDSHL